jgi:EmrB/QacA subfamily drug resistance transporter
LLRDHPNYRWFALAVIMLGSMMGTLDGSIANVAMPTIAKAYHHPVDDAEWVILAFMLVTASTLVMFGRLGDIFGQKRIYLSGFAIFGASSLACSFAPSLGVLIAGRAVQALGAAMLLSSNQALIVDIFPVSMRGRAIGMNGAAVAVGLSLGPIIGGTIVTYFDWQWIFLINVPISIFAMLGAWRVLRPMQPKGGGLDPWGALGSVATLFSFALALSRSHVWGWQSPATLGLLAFSLLSLGLFIWLERRVPAPTLDLSLFSIRVFAFSVLAAFIYFIAFAGVTFIVPLNAQTTLHQSALAAGLLLTPITAMNIILAPVAGALSDRVPVRYVSTFGALVVSTGLLLLSRLPAIPSLGQMLTALMVAGCGTAVFTQPNNSAIMGSAPPKHRGTAGGTLATARTTGQLVGVSVASAIYFTHGAHAYFGITAAVMLGVAALSWMRE